MQIDHCSPPKFDGDWAREDVRNLTFICQSCNGTKGKKSYDDWLDEQEHARISNAQHPDGAGLLGDPVGPAEQPQWLMGLEWEET